ncbi:MAG TPA: DUF983 domain-containing protein [Parvibaculum sp.]|uniref:DUF983 domain-containing protein n=1 Tax=Parvibaculum sp. TaxID=2024848 RepID=UPI002D1E199D|nr:DUF983 domain-containing protein [Parvibaculum sp.]HMM15001.1 DUF983 domain-containing protein [Parvibaculum sp.]
MSTFSDMYESAGPEIVRHEVRPFGRSVWRGFSMRCPACGEGHIFRAFLKVADRCPHCSEELFHHQADDAPPYFTILIVGHLIVPIMLAVELEYMPPLWVHMTLWPLATLLLSLILLPRIKGAVVGLQWSRRMHGFGDEPDF